MAHRFQSRPPGSALRIHNRLSVPEKRILLAAQFRLLTDRAERGLQINALSLLRLVRIVREIDEDLSREAA